MYYYPKEWMKFRKNFRKSYAFSGWILKDISHQEDIQFDNYLSENRKNDLILIMTPEKQDKTLELSKNCAN